MDRFWNNEPLVSQELKLVHQHIGDAVSQSRGFIRPYIQELVLQRGKMLRPACVLAASKFGNSEHTARAVELAAGVELIHAATLVHDDVIDQARLRRGEETLHERIGNRKAVMAGDYLMVRAFSLLSQDTTEHIDPEKVSHRISRLCESEIDQDSETGNFSITIPHYLRRIGGKTASLFSLSCYLGAAAAELPRLDIHRLSRFGYHMGMLFQIQDDILDYEGNESSMGKEAVKDLQDGIATLPLLCALNNDTAGRLESLIESNTLDQEKLSEAVELVHSLGGVEQAKNKAEQYTRRALKDISGMPQSDSREFFSRLLSRLVGRQT